MDTIRIFDTTLRDGEQSPGATLNMAEKLEIARLLDAMGVDVIEAGFPISSDGDFESVKQIATELKNSVICGLARCVPIDIDRAGAALAPAKGHARIHTFISSSKIHLEHQIKKTEAEVLKIAEACVKQAVGYTPGDVEFSAMDATRTDIGFLCDLVSVAIEAGATTVNLPDTVGYATPAEYQKMFEQVIARVPSVKAKGIILSTHCHDDLGLAAANSLAGVAGGARQIECTINGIGERAGNAALEEVVMAIRTRAGFFNASTKIDTTKIYPASRMVSTLTGLVVQRNKAIVGENAFAHESGIHQDGVLKNRETYEIINPTLVGIPTNALVLGKHSGRHAFKDRALQLGYVLSDEQLEKAFARFKTLADKKKEVFDEDLEAIIDDQLEINRGMWELTGLQVTAGSNTTPTATVSLRDTNGEVMQDASVGDGPVDAIYSAISRLTGVKASLTDYRIRAVTKGKEALGEVHVELDHNGDIIRGRGISTDILEASALAYLSALNRLRSQGQRDRRVMQTSGV